MGHYVLAWAIAGCLGLGVFWGADEDADATVPAEHFVGAMCLGGFLLALALGAVFGSLFRETRRSE